MNPSKRSHSSNKGHHSMKHKFSKDEDALILKMVEENGSHYWGKIAKKLVNRTPRQCRERWKHYLRPGIKNGPWSKEEDDLLINLYNEIGPKWSIIRGNLPGRTDVNIKNRWSLIIRKSDKTQPNINKESKLKDQSPKQQQEESIFSKCTFDSSDFSCDVSEFEEVLKDIENGFTPLNPIGPFFYQTFKGA